MPLSPDNLYIHCKCVRIAVFSLFCVCTVPCMLCPLCRTWIPVHSSNKEPSRAMGRQDKRKKSSGVQYLILLSVVTAKSVKAQKESSQPSDLISWSWFLQVCEGHRRAVCHSFKPFSKATTRDALFVHYISPRSTTMFTRAFQNTTQINSNGNSTCPKEGKGPPTLLLLWTGSNLKINFCSRVCSVVCCLSYLTPRAHKGTLFQALLAGVLAHMVLNRHPAGNRGAQEKFQLQRNPQQQCFQRKAGANEQASYN